MHKPFDIAWDPSRVFAKLTFDEAKPIVTALLRAEQAWRNWITGWPVEWDAVTALVVRLQWMENLQDSETPAGRISPDALATLRLSELYLTPLGGRSRHILPYAATISFDRRLLRVLLDDLAGGAAVRARAVLFDLLSHELGHALGFGTAWEANAMLAGSFSDPVFTGSNATREYAELTGKTPSPVPVHDDGDAGDRLVHWRLGVFGKQELMVPGVYQHDRVISRVTVGSFEDLGYVVRYPPKVSFELPQASGAKP